MRCLSAFETKKIHPVRSKARQEALKGSFSFVTLCTPCKRAVYIGYDVVGSVTPMMFHYYY